MPPIFLIATAALNLGAAAQFVWQGKYASAVIWGCYAIASAAFIFL
jgi:hypothetical protein